MNTSNWIDLKQDADTGIETIRAHFEGHAYDPHWHDAYLVGFTEQGVQRFHCGRQRYDSVPGKVILIEPGEVHDGEAPTEDPPVDRQATGLGWRTMAELAGLENCQRRG